MFVCFWLFHNDLLSSEVLFVIAVQSGSIRYFLPFDELASVQATDICLVFCCLEEYICFKSTRAQTALNIWNGWNLQKGGRKERTHKPLATAINPKKGIVVVYHKLINCCIDIVHLQYPFGHWCHTPIHKSTHARAKRLRQRSRFQTFAWCLCDLRQGALPAPWLGLRSQRIFVKGFSPFVLLYAMFWI